MRQIITRGIKFYQQRISPHLPHSCRFYPTCSQYALEAVEKHGTFKGVILAGKRLLKCHPFHPGGIDLVRGQKKEKKCYESN